MKLIISPATIFVLYIISLFFTVLGFGPQVAAVYSTIIFLCVLVIYYLDLDLRGGYDSRK